MKKLISRFKNWCIKKLGGHTDEEVTALLRQPPLVHKYNFRPIILRTETTCNAGMLSTVVAKEEAQYKFLTEIMDQLGTALLDQNLVQISCMDDIPSGIRTYRAELAVISPEDLRNAR